MIKLEKLNALCGLLVTALLSGCVVPVANDPSTAASTSSKPEARTPPAATMTGPVLTAPSGTARPQAPAASGHTTTSLMRDIALEIGDAACDTDAQCHTVGVGAKACGGPEGYVAWSSKGDNKSTGKLGDKSVRLRELAAAHTSARQTENERSGMRSNCSVTPDPGAVCRPRSRDGLRVCQTVPDRRSRAV